MDVYNYDCDLTGSWEPVVYQSVCKFNILSFEMRANLIWKC